jgi:hypothetical protein
MKNPFSLWMLKFVFNLTVLFGFILPSKFDPKTTKQKIQCFSFAPSKYHVMKSAKDGAAGSI